MRMHDTRGGRVKRTLAWTVARWRQPGWRRATVVSGALALLGLAAWRVDAELKARKQAATAEQLRQVTQHIEALRDTIAREVIAWDTLRVVGNSLAHLRTQWRDGRLYYQFRVGLTPKLRERVQFRSSRAAFVIGFADSAGFSLGGLPVYLDSMTHLADRRGQNVMLERRNSLEFPRDEYLRAKEWKLAWRGL